MPASEVLDLIIKIALFFINVTTVAKCIEREYDYLKRKMEDREQIINPLK